MTTKPKTAPDLRFPEFAGGWIETPMGELLSFKNGYNAAKEQYGTGVKFINVLDIIQNDFITYDRIIGSVEIPAKDFEKNSVKYGDLLFQRSSETREEVGQTNVYLDRDNLATFGGFVIRGRSLMDGGFNPVFFNSMLKTSKARKDITSRSGGSTHYNIGQESLADVLVSIAPTLPEQRKIADFLTTVDARIAQLRQKKALLENYKKGVMQQLFSQALRFKDDHGNDFPEWEEKQLGEISKCFSGGTPSSGKRAYYGGSIPFIRSAEIAAESTALFLTEKGLKESAAKMVEAGDLLVALYGANSGEVGISKVTGAINQAILCVRTKQSVRFLYFWLEFSKQSIVNTYLQGGQGNLSGKIVQSLNIQIPSLPEQTKIANFLTALDRKIESVSSQITHTQTFKKGLLQQMFV